MTKYIFFTTFLFACGGVRYDIAEVEHSSEINGMTVVILRGAEVPEEFEAWMMAAAKELDGAQEGLTFILQPCEQMIDDADESIGGRYYWDGYIKVRGCPSFVTEAVPHELTHRWLHKQEGDGNSSHDAEFWRAFAVISSRILYN